MECSNCGAILADNEIKFCQLCGFELSLKNVKASVNPENSPISQHKRKRRGCC